MSVRSSIVLIIAAAALALTPRLHADLEEVSPADRAADIDWPMYSDPQLPPIELIHVHDQRMKGIWAASLKRPDVETRRRAALEIGSAARHGMPGLDDLAATLIEQMNAADAHPVMVLAAAQALIHLDAKHAAASFIALNERGAASGVLRGDTVGKDGKTSNGGNAGIEFVLLTDPALAAWNIEGAKPIWMKRLTAADTARPVLVSAMAQLAAVKHAPAAEALRTHALARGGKDQPLRLHAARSLAALGALGAAAPAPVIDRTGKPPLIDRLIAATIAASQPGEAAIDELAALALDDEAAVAAIALTRLIEAAPDRLPAERTTALLQRPDPTVRLLAARLIAARRTPQAVAELAPLLDDVSPSVRYYVRSRMIEFGGDGDGDGDRKLAALVREHAMTALAGASWRGIEQASVILGRLDHEPAAGDLVKRLSHPRSEVRLAAIVALRRMSIKDDQLLTTILAYAQREADAFLAAVETAKRDNTRPFHVDRHRDRLLAQSLQLLGLMRHKPGGPLMQRLIPKNSGFWSESRAAAIWSLGLLYENDPQPKLAADFVGRLSDLDPTNPEMIGVRRMSAISLGRMKASEQGMAALQSFLKSEQTSQHVGGACRWAIMQITGKELPPLPPREVSEADWVIQPLRDPQ